MKRKTGRRRRKTRRRRDEKMVVSMSVTLASMNKQLMCCLFK